MRRTTGPVVSPAQPGDAAGVISTVSLRFALGSLSGDTERTHMVTEYTLLAEPRTFAGAGRAATALTEVNVIHD